MTDEGKDDGVDVHISKLMGDSPEVYNALAYIGGVAANTLKNLGIVTFALGEDGFVRWVDPHHVYLTPDALPEQNLDRPVKWVRPIVGDGQPRYIGMKQGQPWLIEFGDEEEENGG